MSEEGREALERLPDKVRARVSFVRDVALALGVPALAGVGIWLHEAQISATQEQNASLKAIFEAQQKAAETQARALAEQNATLKLTQYDRALAEIKSQSELFQRERAQAKTQLDQAQAQAEELKKQVDEIKFRLDQVEGSYSRFRRWINNNIKRSTQPSQSPPGH